MLTHPSKSTPDISDLLYLKERYELAIAGSKDGIWDWDLERETVFVSDRYKTMLGYEPNELEDTNKLFEKFVHPEDRDRVYETLDEFINNERSNYDIVFRMRHRKGHYIYIQSKAMAKRDLAGKAIRIAGSHTDITTTRLYQEQLQEKSMISEMSHDGISITDVEGKVLWANESFLKTMEIPASELIGKRPRDLFCPENLELLDQIAERNLTNYSFEFKTATFSKKKIWISLTSYVVRDKDENPIKQIEIVRDITKSKEDETRLKELSIVAERAMNGIIVTDEGGKVIWANESFLDLMEIPFEKLVGQKPRSLFNVRAEDTPETIELVNGSTFSVEFEVNTYTNKRKWVALDNSVYQDASGAFRQIEIVSDITERKSKEKELYRLNNILQTLLDSIPGYVVCRDSDGKFVFVNAQFASLFNKSPEEVTGLSDADYGAKPEEIAFYLEADRQVLETGEPLYIPEETILRADGTRGTFETTKIPISGLEKKAVLILANDITEKKAKQAKKAQAKIAKERYNNVLIELSTISFSNFETLFDCLQYLTELCVKTIKIERVSILKYIDNNSFLCLDAFDRDTNTHSKNEQYLECEFPKYFESLRNRLAIVADNVNDIDELEEFRDKHFSTKGIKSVLDIPIRIEGEIDGVVWWESKEYREWSDEDVAFARSLGEIISIAQESFRRRVTQVKLERANYRLENILANSGDLSFVLSKKGLTIEKYYQNENKIDLIVPKEQFLGLEFEKIGFPPQAKAVIMGALNETIRTGKKQNAEYFLDLTNGKEWYTFTSSLILFQKKFDEIIVTIENISEKKKYQLELEQISSILNETQYSTKTGGWELDLVTGVIKLSDEVYKLYEEDKDYCVTVSSSLKYYSSKDRYKIKKGIFNCIRSREPYDQVLELTTDSGKVKWIRYRVWAGNKTGKVTKVFGSLQDITSMKKVENDLRKLNNRFEWYGIFLDGTKDAIQVANEVGQMVYVNNMSAERLGISPEDVFDYNISDFEPHFTEERIWKDHVALLKKEDSITMLGTTVNIKTGDSIPVEVTVRYIERDSEGFVVAVLRDVSERNKADEALKEALRKAEIANVAKSEFLANMSHEIRTPLNGVIGFTDLLLGSGMNETQKEYLQTIHHSANSLLDIINDILDFSKIESGKIELNVERADIFQIGNEVTEIVKFAVQKKNLELLLNISTLLPKYIWVDVIRLRQVLINLLGNAVKFTESGEVELKVTQLGCIKDDRAVFRFAVRDTGIGINNVNQKKIFEAFSQEDASTTKRFGGTGLGLAISNKLLSLMDTELQLESEVGVGSLFYFDLSLSVEQEPKRQAANFEYPDSILVVDDNASNRKILSQMLITKMSTVETVSSGEEAIQLLKNGNMFDCVLIDYFMPRLNGIETVRHIRKLDISNKDQPTIILFSSDDNDALLKECEGLNISQKLIKPLSSKMLFQSLAKLNEARIGENEKELFLKKGSNKLFGAEIAILLAEDNKVNRLLAKVVFNILAPKARVIEAVNGLEAVQQFDTEKIDIIFMDVQMPEMNGYEATRKIRSLEKEGEHCPIIALTAGTVKGEEEKCLGAGMDQYVTKPFLKATIENVMLKWLGMDGAEKTELSQSNKLHIDFEQLRENVENNSVFLNAFFPHVKESITTSLVELKDANNNEDYEMLNIVAHRIKGTAMSASFGVLTSLCAELEYMEEYTQQGCSSLIDKIEEEIKILVKMI